MSIKGNLPDIPEYPPVEHSDFKSLSHQDLIQECLKNSRPAWDEFFHRFISEIKNTIKYKLGVSYGGELSSQQEAIWEIYEKIVFKLYRGEILKQCPNPLEIRSWLKTVAANQTIDWIRGQNRKKRSHEKSIENSMKSLAEPLGEDITLTLQDTIAYIANTNQDLTDDIENVLNRIAGLNDEQQLWIIRLSIMSQVPLSKDEIDNLAQFNGKSINEIKSKLGAVIQGVEEKEKRYEVSRIKAIRLWYEIGRLEAKLSDHYYQLEDNKKAELREEIIEKIKERGKCLKQGLKIVKPSNREIADLVGITQQQAGQVSTILIRLRARLEKKMENIKSKKI